MRRSIAILLAVMAGVRMLGFGIRRIQDWWYADSALDQFYIQREAELDRYERQVRAFLEQKLQWRVYRPGLLSRQGGSLAFERSRRERDIDRILAQLRCRLRHDERERRRPVT